MAEQPNISQILAALGEPSSGPSDSSFKLTAGMTATQRPNGTPTSQHLPQQPPPPHSYPPLSYHHAGPPPGTSSYPVPQPSSSGSIDLSNIRPINSGSVSLADAVNKARGIAAENGLGYGGREDGLTGRQFRRSRTRSRSPRMVQGFRDNYNPYRDERRDEPRRLNQLPYGRERSYSPDNRGSLPGARFTPPPGRGFATPDDRSLMGRRTGDDSGVEIIPIEAGVVGLIIGRQGETLRRVEAETGTRIQFLTGPEAGGPMRQCKLTGPRGARDDAKADIFRIIEENGKAVGHSVSGRAPPPPDRNMDGGMGSGVKQVSTHQPALRTGEDATQIMVPNRTVGLIIGRGGETIRDLQERSQCHVNIVGEEKSISGLRPVNLIGTPSAAAMAKELIMEIVESDTKSQANQQGGMPRENPGLPVIGGGEKINDRIIVPSEAVGMIIGKGGETIKNMQTDTGCKINVSPATGQDIERDIGLVGSRESIERAKHAIMEKVHAVVSHVCYLKMPSDSPSNSRKRTTAPAVEEAADAEMTANLMVLPTLTIRPPTSDLTEVSKRFPQLMM